MQNDENELSDFVIVKCEYLSQAKKIIVRKSIYVNLGLFVLKMRLYSLFETRFVPLIC